LAVPEFSRRSAEAQKEERTMPVYEYFCDKCQREVTVTMAMSEREKGGVACPACGSRELRPLVGSFFSKTSRKS
jgi:putative FmdB family regulatory protein